VKARGFTLVEMLIALTIFGMITAAGVVLLGVTVRTQETSDRLLDQQGELRRLGSLLTADLGQAAARTSRDADGRPRPAFIGGAGDQELLLGFVRGGNEEEPLQRVEYRLRDGQLLRLAFSSVDGDVRATPIFLLSGLRSLHLRYRNRDGEWNQVWTATDATMVPRAVELVRDDPVHGSVRQLFLVGAGR
jgi:general secretion pathway protein J